MISRCLQGNATPLEVAFLMEFYDTFEECNEPNLDDSASDHLELSMKSEILTGSLIWALTKTDQYPDEVSTI